MDKVVNAKVSDTKVKSDEKMMKKQKEKAAKIPM
jgi:hypothetical protein